MRRMGGFLLVLAACSGKTGGPVAAYGTVEAREVRTASRVGGLVTEVIPYEGDTVKQGQVLVRFDLSDLAAQRDQAQAAAEAADAQERLLQAGARREDVQAARDALDEARARQQLSEQDLARVEILRQNNAVPQQQLDDAKTAVDVAKTNVSARQAQLDKLLGGARSQELQAADASRRAAEAQVRTLDARLEDRELRSPVNGVVLHRISEPGEVARPGETLLVLGETSRPYIDVYVAEGDVGRVKVGTRVQVALDGLPGRTFAGTVRSVSDEAEFTPKNVQTADQRARLVFRTRVDIDDPQGETHPGMPGHVLLPEAGTPEARVAR